MTWSGVQIHNLRIRLGLSRYELSQKLGCDCKVVEDWESEKAFPNFRIRNNLERLEFHAQECSACTQSFPIIEHEDLSAGA